MILSTLTQQINVFAAEDWIEPGTEKHFQMIQNWFSPALGTFLLKKLGLEELKFLGQGRFSATYRVLYQGKSCVAKITRNYNDVEISKKLFLLRQAMGELGKHIMIIHGIKEVETNYIFKMIKTIKNFKYYIIIAEELKPLSPHIKDLLFDFYSLKKKEHITKYRLSIFSNYDQLKNVIDYIFERYVPYKFEQKEELKDEIIDKILSVARAGGLGPEFTKIFIKEAELLDLNNKELFTQLKSGSIILKHIYLEATESDHVIPWKSTQSQEKKLIVLNLPETRSFFQSLMLLHDKFGVSWDDLTPQNIMQRDDNTLVVSDPGEFTMDSNK